MLRNLKSFFDQSNQKNEIIIVSGLPRSGTSLMMKMLQQSGFPILTDQVREADGSNPQGYFEHEGVKDLAAGRKELLDESQGKVVKIISTLLPFLPEDYCYKVILMTRDMGEIVASQKSMYKVQRGEESSLSDQELAELLEKDLKKAIQYIKGRDNISHIKINYNRLINSPNQELIKLKIFLEKDIPINKLIKVINPDLYRQRRELQELSNT